MGSDIEVTILLLEKPVLSPKMPRLETRVMVGRRVGDSGGKGFTAASGEESREQRWAAPNNRVQAVQVQTLLSAEFCITRSDPDLQSVLIY